MRASKLLIWMALAALLQACVAVQPQQSKNEKASAVNVQLGIGYMQQNKLELASEKLSKALRQNPGSAAVHNAYAILQDRLRQLDKAEYHYKRAVKLDPKDSQAANNYGAFLCRNGREREAEEHFLRAVKNPLYKTPEFAYTNAAICLIKIDRKAPAKDYLRKALAAKSDFRLALFAMGDLLFDEYDYTNARIYLERYHKIGKPTAKSLWLAIRNELELGGTGSSTVERLGKALEEGFADSEENQSWQRIQ